jgi:hypothetical protein
MICGDLFDRAVAYSIYSRVADIDNVSFVSDNREGGDCGFHPYSSRLDTEIINLEIRLPDCIIEGLVGTPFRCVISGEDRSRYLFACDIAGTAAADSVADNKQSALMMASRDIVAWSVPDKVFVTLSYRTLLAYTGVVNQLSHQLCNK